MPHAFARSQSQFRRILVVKLADLGDLLTITPALQALRAAHPSARIDLLTPPSSAGLLGGAPFLDGVVMFDKFAFDTLRGVLDIGAVTGTLRFLLRLRLAHYDALVVFHHYTSRWGAAKFQALSVASGARVVAGIDNGRGHFLTARVRDDGFGAMHEADYWLHVAALLGADPRAGWRPSLPLTDSDREAAAGIISSGMQHAGPVVAIHPGAGAYSHARIWPLEGFAGVALSLVDTAGAHIIVLGGHDELESAARLVRLIDRPEHVLNVAGRTSIHQTAALLERCDLFVGNDSGPMHIAAAMGTQVVAVFGPSNQRAWGPYTPPGQANPHVVVARDLPCMPCFYRAHSLGLREGCGSRPCLTRLPSERVLEECLRVLASPS